MHTKNAADIAGSGVSSLPTQHSHAVAQIKGGLVNFAQLLLDAGMDQFDQGITREGLLLLNTAEEVLNTSSPDQHKVMQANIHAMIGIMYVELLYTTCLCRANADHYTRDLGTTTLVSNNALRPSRDENLP